MSKILTIIIPTYNMERYLDKCLSSLVIDDEELMSAIEVLIINDGSKDHSSEIAHSYEKKWPQTFCVIDKENGNYGSCVNKGLEVTKGKYVKILDADDSFDTSALKEYVKVLKGQDADMIVTSGVNVNSDGEITFEWDFSYETNKLYSVEELKHVWVHDVTHKTSILRSINYKQTEGISYTDEEWVFYPMIAIKDFFTVSLRLYRYTIGREGQTMNPANWTKAMSHEILVSKKLFGFLEKNKKELGMSKEYYRLKMTGRMRGFYYRALITCGLYDNSELAGFDKYIEKNCPEYYEATMDAVVNTRLFDFYFVRYWRKAGYHLNKHLNRFILYRLYQKILH